MSSVFTYTIPLCNVVGQWPTLCGSMAERSRVDSNAIIVVGRRVAEGQQGSNNIWHIGEAMWQTARRFHRM